MRVVRLSLPGSFSVLRSLLNEGSSMPVNVQAVSEVS
jgi:hypothetical protein